MFLQAAVGSFALDIAVANNLGQDIENMARTVSSTLITLHCLYLYEYLFILMKH